MLQPLTKVCTICKETKAADRFHVGRTKGREWLQGRCKDCNSVYMREWIQRPGRMAQKSASNRKRKLVTRYGINQDIYDAMLLAQGNACVLCLERFTKTPHVDHDHETGAIRGLLCQMCNHGIGLLNEDPAVLQRAIEYLARKRSLYVVA